MNFLIRKHHIIDEDTRIGIQSRDQVLQDDDCLVIGPVMQNIAQVVEFRPLDNLWLEKVVYLDLDTIDFWYVYKCLREVLEDQLPE